MCNISRRSLNKTVANRRDVRQQIDDLEDHRPFFTYWVTVVQILVLFLSIFSYGLGPFGIDLSHQSGAVSILFKFSFASMINIMAHTMSYIICT